MKKLLLITLLLIPYLGFSQTTTKPIDGFLGIKFGTNKAAVIAAVKAKGGVVVENSEPNEVIFNKLNLGRHPSLFLRVEFIDNKAYKAEFVFKAEVDDKTIDYYNDLVSQINDVYGTGKSHKQFRSTFTDGDGYEITAIQEGDADYFTDWKDENGFIQAKIDVKLNILLFYIDNALNAQAKAKEKEKDKGDF